MLPLYRSSFLPTFSILLCATVCAAQQTPHPAVCRVIVDEAGGTAYGSGTLIDARDGFAMVVTNWHVVRDATGKIEVLFPDGFRCEARPLKLDETWDLAALVIWRPAAQPVTLANTPPRPGEPLTICGYGRGTYRAAPGRCTDYYSPKVGMPEELVELNVEARQGDSGGPIFNARGELAGVLFGAGQGTTLGSFQGRVKSFLASLAPDIGAASSTAIASAATGPRAMLGPPGLPPSSTVDPFLMADQAHGPVVLGLPQAIPEASSAAPVVSQLQPVTRAVAETARLADTTPTAKWTAPAFDAGKTKIGWFTPATAREKKPGGPPQASQSPLSTNGIDWLEDGRSLLALMGVAAIVAAGLRSGD